MLHAHILPSIQSIYSSFCVQIIHYRTEQRLTLSDGGDSPLLINIQNNEVVKSAVCTMTYSGMVQICVKLTNHASPSLFNCKCKFSGTHTISKKGSIH